MLSGVVDGRFQVERDVGRGATGMVYQAKDLSNGRTVAIKVLHASTAANEEFVARFERECRLLRALDHVNAVRVIHTGMASERLPYVAMEFVAGNTLVELVHKHGPQTAERVGTFLRDIAAVLDVAHEKDIIHRDLKPGNIMLHVDENGREIVKVLDFGLAKILHADPDNDTVVTTAGIAMGTPEYMSPEQAMGKPLDKLSDI
ncbi:MAG: serine/threonine-protein kinase, partial [Planctomycetia bacterium]